MKKKSTKPRPIKAHVVQGSCQVNSAEMRKLGPTAQEWYFDLKAKRADVNGYGSNDILIGYTDATSGHDPAKQDTNIWFDLPVGWEVRSAHISKYYLRVIVAKSNDRWSVQDVWQHEHHCDKHPTKVKDVCTHE